MADTAQQRQNIHHDGKQSVRFPDGQNDNCNEIHVIQVQDRENEFEIHAGFFKTEHKYEVVFSVTDTAGIGNNITWSTPAGVAILIRDIQHKNSEIVVTLEYHSDSRDGIIKEVFSIKSKEDQTKEIKVSFRAEVLGHDQGTPMLKDGVRCIEKPQSASSMSDSS